MEPELHPNIVDETPEVRERGYRHIREALAFFERQMRETRPDAVIIVGDDQDENFTEDNLPQIAVYTGAEIHTTERASDGSRLRGPKYPCHADLAHDLLNGLVDREFDVASCSAFPKDELLSHAHGPIMRRVLPDADIPVVPVFLNAIHVPAPSPRRCYRLGAAMREIIESRAGKRAGRHLRVGRPVPFHRRLSVEALLGAPWRRIHQRGVRPEGVGVDEGRGGRQA